MFNKVEVLNREAHAQLRFNAVADYSFAAREQTAPVTATEIIEAAKEYPIVFAPEGDVVPMALLGLHPETNSFVDADGRWRHGYIPAHIRRYPFILMATRDPETFVPGLDREAVHFSSGDGEPLFSDEGKLGPATQRAVDFLRQLESEMMATKRLLADLRDHDVLAPKRVEFRTKDGATRALAGFSMVDGERLSAVSDEVFLAWRRRGILPLLFACAASGSNVRRMPVDA